MAQNSNISRGISVKPYDPMYGQYPVNRQLNQPGLLHHPRLLYSDSDLTLTSPFHPRLQTQNPYQRQFAEPSFADQMLLDSHQILTPGGGPHPYGQNFNQSAASGHFSRPGSRASASGNLVAPEHMNSTGNCSCCPENSHLGCCKRFPSLSDVTRPPFLDPSYNLIDKYDYNYDNYYRSKREQIARPYWTSSAAPSRPVTPADINTSPGIHTSKYVDTDDPKAAFKNQMKYFVQERKQALGGTSAYLGHSGAPYTSAGILGETQTGSESDLNALLHLYSHPPDPVRDKFPPPGVASYQSIPQAMVGADQNVMNPRMSTSAMNLIHPGSMKHHQHAQLHHQHAQLHQHHHQHAQPPHHQVHWKDGGPTIDYI